MSSNLVFPEKMKQENDLKIEELDRILKLFPRNIILILSILETCCALLAIISRHYFLGDGIWTGPIFLIASLIGFLSWFNPSKLRYFLKMILLAIVVPYDLCKLCSLKKFLNHLCFACTLGLLPCLFTKQNEYS